MANRVKIEGVNLNETEGWDGDSARVAPGVYLVEVEEAAVEPAKTGTPQLNLVMNILQGADTQAFNGGKGYHHLALTAKAAKRLKHVLVALGAPLDAEGGFDVDSLPGLQMWAEAYENSYEVPDPSTGQMLAKTSIKWKNETPVEAAQAAAPAAAPVMPVKTAPAAPARAAGPATMPRPAGRPSLPGRPARQ